MASEQFSLCWDNFHKNMSSGMNSLLENEDLVDVTLAVEGKCLKAHKMVLSVCSPYFKELFKSNPCQHPIVFMKDVSYVALSDLLQFMYQGEVQVSQENLTTFIKTAEALQIKGLTGDGNGSADSETVETTPAPHEKSAHQVEEYKSVPRPKKQVAAPVTAPSPAVKRQRLSVSSSDSQSPAVAKTEPLAATPCAAEPVQFKMEPYDQGQALIDETGDENFGDDNMDDANVDDTEDYSMMEGGTVGDEEPQAGTSTDGAGEGQEDDLMLSTALKKLPKSGIVVGGFTYHQNTIKKDSRMRYLVCSEYKRLVCKARAILPIGAPTERLILRKGHNHPPYHEASVRDMFIREIKCSIVNQPSKPLKRLYEDVSELYLRCAMMNEIGCKASYVINLNLDGSYGDEMRCIAPHNHPPNELAVQTEKFLVELQKAVEIMPMSTHKIYNFVAQSYPEVARVYSYKNVMSRMHRWLKKVKQKSE